MGDRTMISSLSAEDDAVATMAETEEERKRKEEEAKRLAKEAADKAIDDARAASQEGGE